MSTDRRSFLRQTTLGAAILSREALNLSPVQAADHSSEKSAGLIVRSRRPLDLETPVDRLDLEFTPNSWFYVRNHFGEPAVNPKGWSILFDGLFKQSQTRPLSELFQRHKRHERPAVAMCAGNGRGLFKPTVPGLQWERGAVGQAMWSGISLADLLDDLGLKADANHIIFETGDTPPSAKTPPYTRSLPLERLMQNDILLADRMNGEPLPLLHGGPVRLVVPTWTANHWIKWIRRMTASAEASPAFFQQTAYKMPVPNLPKDATPTPDQIQSVTTLNVKSQITWPPAGSSLARGTHTIKGLAWTGPGLIQKVELRSGSDQPWSEAKIISEKRVEGAWVRWEWPMEARSTGVITLTSRATDSNGETQPNEPYWNKSGYLFNALDPLKIQII